MSNKIIVLILICVSAISISGCIADVPPMNCQDPDFACYINQAMKGVVVVRGEIAFWSKVNLIMQVLIATFGIVATVMIALQGDKNKHWTRPIGLVATALVTGLTSALVAFHVPDNVDKLIDTVERMTIVTNEFDNNAEKLKAGRSDEEVKEAYKKDRKFREAAGDLTTKFCYDYNKDKISMLRLLGTVGHLNTPRPQTDIIKIPKTEK